MNLLRSNLKVLFLVLAVVSPTLATDNIQLDASFDGNSETVFASMTELFSLDDTNTAKISNEDAPEKDSSPFQTRSLTEKNEYLDEVGDRIGEFTPDIHHATSARTKPQPTDVIYSVVCTIAGKVTTLFSIVPVDCPDQSKQLPYFTKNLAGFETLSPVQHSLIQATQITLFEEITNV